MMLNHPLMVLIIPLLYLIGAANTLYGIIKIKWQYVTGGFIILFLTMALHYLYITRL